MRFRNTIILLAITVLGLTSCAGSSTARDPVTGTSPKKLTGKQHEITLFNRYLKKDQKITGTGTTSAVSDPEYAEYLQWRRGQEFKEYQQWKKDNN